MSNRDSARIINYTIFSAILIALIIALLLFSNTIKPIASSVAPIIISMAVSVIITFISLVITLYQVSKGRRMRPLFDTEQGKGEVLRLKQRESELEKQRTELETKQKSLIWQIEAAVLAKEDPRLAVITAYQGIEEELQRVVNLRYPGDIAEELDKSMPRVFHNTSLLIEALGPESVEAIKQLYYLRNRIVHGEVTPEEVSEDKATEYVQRAISLARIIISLG